MKCKKKKTYQIWLGEKSEWDRTTGRSQLKRSKMQTKSKWVQLISAGLWPSPLPLNKLLWEWWWWEDSSEREILGQLGALERKQRGKWRPLNSPGSASLWRKTLQLAMISFVSVFSFAIPTKRRGGKQESNCWRPSPLNTLVELKIKK